MRTLREEFGDIDIYLFDQLLKGRFVPGSTVLDAGCGGGRNIVYMMRSGYTVYGIDHASEAINRVRALAAGLAPHLPADNFRVGSIESLPFADSSIDIVLSIAVLHFAEDEPHFFAMFSEMWRVLKPGGIFFCRLASDIGLGLQHTMQHIHGRRYVLPDGSERFLVDEEMLLSIAKKFGGTLLEPIKTVNVQNYRCMTTLCMQKNTEQAQ